MLHGIGNDILPLFLTTSNKSHYNSRQMIKPILSFSWMCGITASSLLRLICIRMERVLVRKFHFLSTANPRNKQ